MSLAQIVFVHIPKTSGTSQQQMFTDVYGAEQVFWHGGTNAGEEAKAIVVGGHRVLSRFEPPPDTLFASVLREPVERAVSYFRWISDPAHGKGRVSIRREDLHERWLEKGLDPESLENTLARCPEFRRKITNTQCRQLSPKNATFEGVLSELSRGSWIIGSLDNLQAFSDCFHQLLGVTQATSHKINTVANLKRPPLAVTPVARRQLTELVGEDQRLYDYVVGECGGLYKQLKCDAALPERARGRKIERMPIGNRLAYKTPERFNAWKKLELEVASSEVVLDARGQGRVTVRIRNRSHQSIFPQLFSQLSLSFHIYDSAGERLVGGGNRSLIFEEVPARGFLDMPMNIQLTPRQIGEAREIEMSIVWEGKFWLDEMSDNQSRRVKLVSVPAVQPIGGEDGIHASST